MAVRPAYCAVVTWAHALGVLAGMESTFRIIGFVLWLLSTIFYSLLASLAVLNFKDSKCSMIIYFS